MGTGRKHIEVSIMLKKGSKKLAGYSVVTWNIYTIIQFLLYMYGLGRGWLSRFSLEGFQLCVGYIMLPFVTAAPDCNVS